MKKIGILLLTVFLLIGCSSQKADDTTILVAAAASLKNVYEELIPIFEQQNPGINVEGTYDSSGKLQTQIEEGLEADVFMPASTKQMNELIEKNLIDKTTNVELLENEIVLIVPSNIDSQITSFEDIKKASTIVLGDPDYVPAGQYAKEVLMNLNLWDGIQDKVSFATNATEVLIQVAQGSADAGIVYATDASSMPSDVIVVAKAPAGSLKAPVIYPVAIVNGSKNKEIAQKFIEFLKTEQAMEVFQKYGFSAN